MRIRVPFILAAEKFSANLWRPTGIGVLLGFLLVCQWGCASVPVPRADLEEASRDYALRLRWSDYQGAARHMDESLSDDFLSRFREQDDLHIVEVRREEIRSEPQGNRAAVRMMLEFYRLPSLSVKKIRFVQEWILVSGADSGTAAWRIVSPLPPFPE